MTATENVTTTQASKEPPVRVSRQPKARPEEMKNVHAAVAAAAAAIGAVGKNQRMDGGGVKYKYRGLDDLMDAVHTALTQNGVTFAPHDIQMLDAMERTTKSGSVQHHLRALVTYRIYGPAGDFITATVLAEGTDTGDKAGNKLMSGALKYALGQVLSIPYSGMEDQDATLSEPVQAMGATELHKRLADAADKMNMTPEEISANWRKQNGDITFEQFLELPADRIHAFVRNVVAYVPKAKQR